MITSMLPEYLRRCKHSHALDSKPLAWIFLGPPGVGKGTYSKRVANSLGLTYIAAGDLVRQEIKSGTPLGQEMQNIVKKGKLLSDSLILKVMKEQMTLGLSNGLHGFLLDGFPRTLHQAQALEDIADVQLAMNLNLREDVLVEKCLGRRICSKCGDNYNIADINYPAVGDRPEIVMPPLNPPENCMQYMEKREDDTEKTIQNRLNIYKDGAKPVEDFYLSRGVLLNFEITGGISETLPLLTEALYPHRKKLLEATS